MANEMNKVPCGGFKVEGGLSIDDGILRTGNIVAAEVYRTHDIAEQVGWIVPYEVFQTENASLVFEDDDIRMEVFDCFPAILIAAYKIDFNEDKTVKSFTTLIPFDVNFNLFTVFNLVNKLTVNINDMGGTLNFNKNFEAEEITLPEEMKQIPGFREKGYLLYRVG